MCEAEFSTAARSGSLITSDSVIIGILVIRVTVVGLTSKDAREMGLGRRAAAKSAKAGTQKNETDFTIVNAAQQ